MNLEGGNLVGKVKYLTGRRLNRLFVENRLTKFNGKQGRILYYLWKEDGILG
ncbi:MAG: hypothetical protein MR283_01375 [Erysipelotrichaceae bacterium]|nr:hypothetical protein [Erysipelotrichaceae bacterium]MDY6035610.1 hypothetical protein [Bulleidia sp.]